MEYTQIRVLLFKGLEVWSKDEIANLFDEDCIAESLYFLSLNLLHVNADSLVVSLSSVPQSFSVKEFHLLAKARAEEFDSTFVSNRVAKAVAKLQKVRDAVWSHNLDQVVDLDWITGQVASCQK